MPGAYLVLYPQMMCFEGLKCTGRTSYFLPSDYRALFQSTKCSYALWSDDLWRVWILILLSLSLFANAFLLWNHLILYSAAMFVPYLDLPASDQDVDGPYDDGALPDCVLVVDTGYSFSHITPLLSGQVQWSAVRRSVVLFLCCLLPLRSSFFGQGQCWRKITY